MLDQLTLDVSSFMHHLSTQDIEKRTLSTLAFKNAFALRNFTFGSQVYKSFHFTAQPAIEILPSAIYRWISQSCWLSTSWALSTATRHPPGATSRGAVGVPTHTFLTSSDVCWANGDM